MRLSVVITLSLLWFAGACVNTQTESNFLQRTSQEAAQFTVKNSKYQLDRFIGGTWEGECSPNDKSKESLFFQGNGRLKVTTYMPPDFTDFKSAYEQGLYEILEENRIKLYYLAAGETIEINKLNEDEIKIGGTGSTIIYGCVLKRIKS
jgi:hypothetical protein